MPWKPLYATLAELKEQVRVTDAVDDAAFTRALTAASRAIDHETDRQFGVEAAPVARTYTDQSLILDRRWALSVDDISTPAGLVVAIDEDDSGGYATVLVEGVDYALWPYNANRDGKPWTHLVSPGASQYRWPRWPNSIRVTASFGWASVPSVVNQACLIQAARFFVRRDAAFGVAGSPEIGSELRLLNRLDPDVAVLLSGVKRWWGAAS